MDASQLERIPESTTKTQQPNSGGVAAGGERFDAKDGPSASDDPRLLIASEDNADYQQAVASLTSIGVRRTVADALAREHDATTIRTWVRYALRTSGLKSRAGFVLAMLHKGEQPPDYPATVLSSSQQQPSSLAPTTQQPSWGLTEAFVKQRTEAPPPAPAARYIAIWQAAQERLRERVSSVAWGLWLQHVRLVAAGAGRVQLASPVVVVAETFERRYAGDINEVLEDLLGQEVRVEFGAEHGQLH